MPFTLAHPAAILPIRKLAPRFTSLSALVIGSISPDFIYFIPVDISGKFTHSVMGMFVFCVPASMVAWLIFHVVIRQPAALLLPDRLFSVLPDSAFLPLELKGCLVAVVAGSAALGSYSHLCWDSLTHQWGVFNQYGFLDWLIGSAWGWDIRMHHLLQHGSSLAGLLLLSVATARWASTRRNVRRATGSQHFLGKIRIVVWSGVVLCAMFGGLTAYAQPSSNHLEFVIEDIVIASLAGAGLGILAFCAAWHGHFIGWRCAYGSLRRKRPYVRND